MTQVWLLIGGTTSNEQAAADSRTSNAPNQEDLQSSIAPQLTTSGADPQNQPEIPAAEAEPCSQLPFIEDWPMNDEISDLVDHDPNLSSLVTSELEAFRRAATSFIYQSGVTSPVYQGLRNSKFMRNQSWIGRLINP